MGAKLAGRTAAYKRLRKAADDTERESQSAFAKGDSTRGMGLRLAGERISALADKANKLRRKLRGKAGSYGTGGTTRAPIHNAGGTMNRNAVIGQLTANCDCWKGDQGKKALEGMTDAQLQAVANANRVSTADASTAPQSAEQWFAANAATIPPDVINTIRTAKAIQDREQKALVERIVTANAADEAGRAALRPIYSGMSIDQLTVVANAIPAKRADDAFNPFARRAQPAVVNYGAAEPDRGALAVNAANGAAAEDDDVLPLPVMNYDDLSAFNRKPARRAE
jgi:hypothetical protein